MTVLLWLAAWVALSLPLGVALGFRLRQVSQQMDDDLAAFLLTVPIGEDR